MRTLNLTPKSFWSKKELLAEEFKSLGFYISDHPLNEYKEFFNELDIDTYKDFINSNKSEALIAGTIMSIQEKKSSKGTPFAILKFSDNKSEFELFLFSELLINNRDKLKESNSFVLTLQKDKSSLENNLKRVNVRKIIDLSELVNKTYEKVSIELYDNEKLNELSQLLKTEGKTKINIILNNDNKKYAFELEKSRKFDFATFSAIKDKQYVKKISF